MLQVQNLMKHYAGKCVLNIPEFILPAGEILALVGNNGAGKTTFLRLLLQLVLPDQGKIFLFDRDMTKKNAVRMKDWIGAFLDDSFLIPYLKPSEYYELVGRIHEKDTCAGFERCRGFMPVFPDHTEPLIRALSSGDRQRVGITAALLPGAKMLLLDEPFIHLDPTSSIALTAILRSLHQVEGTTMIISSHHLDQVMEIATRVVLLENGKMMYIGPNNRHIAEKIKDYFYLADGKSVFKTDA